MYEYSDTEWKGYAACEAIASMGLKPKLAFSVDSPVGAVAVGDKLQMMALKRVQGTVNELSEKIDGKIIAVLSVTKVSDQRVCVRCHEEIEGPIYIIRFNEIETMEEL